MTAFATALSALAVAGGAGVVCDRLAALRRPNGDRGDYWARVTRAVVFTLGPILLLSSWLRALVFAILPEGSELSAAVAQFVTLWGWFPFLDSASGLGAYGFEVSLAIPFSVWLGVLGVGLWLGPSPGRSARWIAGGAGFTSSRAWVLALALPFALLLFLTGPELGRGPHGYPAATWASVALIVLSLVGVSLSRGRAPSDPPAEPGETHQPSREAWPGVLAEWGVRAELLCEWEAPRLEGPPPGSSEQKPHPALGALPHYHARIPTELLDVLADHFGLRGTVRLDPRLVFGPEDCGQAEAICLASELLAEQSQGITLVVTARGPAPLREHLARVHPIGADRVAEVTSKGSLPDGAMLFVVDAQTLSDELLPLLGDPALCSRVGLVVWWGLEQFTGVLGANLWAISRRLDRLLRMGNPAPVRTLAFTRSVRSGDDQIESFVQRLLPYSFSPESRVHVPPRSERTVRAYLLASQASAGSSSHSMVTPHLALAGAQASFEAGFATRLEIPRLLSSREAQTFLKETAGPDDRFKTLAAHADVSFDELSAADVLSMRQILSHRGRAGSVETPHYVALVLPENPYARHLVRALSLPVESRAWQTSRRLVCAEANAHIRRTHILRALNEHADTRSGLLKTFLWSEDVLQEILDRIDRDHMLEYEEVRFLDENDRLVVEPRYRSRQSDSRERRPLHTVGTNLVSVRDEGVTSLSAGIRLRVDPERLCIEAYPHRLFMSEGQRYRVREWNDPDVAAKEGTLRCIADSSHCATWRVRVASVSSVRAAQSQASIKRSGQRLGRMMADLVYHEEVTGSLRADLDPVTGDVQGEPVETSFARPIRQQFETRGLVLRTLEPAPIEETASVAQALRHVLPVHLGVEEDALEVVPLYKELIGGDDSYGWVIVDLYPGGIGLIDAIHDDDTLPLALLGFAREWLEQCPCQKDLGCELCLQTVFAHAASGERPVSRSSALSLLRELT